MKTNLGNIVKMISQPLENFEFFNTVFVTENVLKRNIKYTVQSVNLLYKLLSNSIFI